MAELLKDMWPDIWALLSFENPPDLDLDSISVSSKRFVLWTCGKRHVFPRSPAGMVKSKPSHRCLVCTGRWIQPGVNDFPTLKPDLVPFLDYSKNLNSVVGLSPGSTERFFFTCANNHSFSRKLCEASRHTVGTLCFYCTDMKFLSGFNDLGSRYPQIASFWDEAANGFSASHAPRHSTSEFYWKCEYGHTFFESIEKLKGRTHPCLKCFKKRASDDIEQFRGEKFFADYDSARNDKPLEEYSFRSNANVWWRCAENHSFQRKILTHLGLTNARCPDCVATCGSSLVEDEVAVFIQTFELGTLHRNRRLPVIKELDIFLPELSIGIEFNGDYWHSALVKKDPLSDHAKKTQSLQCPGY